ncbi:MAG: TRAP transporter fused permease subunit [Rhodospirillaceae bacterium]|nr:TRAP transporter fused permease subunit [Rhodospirillaceae bacterium]
MAEAGRKSSAPRTGRQTMARFFLLDPALWFSVGVRRRPSGWLTWVVTPLAVALAAYVIVAATVLIVAPWALAAIFLCGMLALAFLAVGASPRSNPARPSPIDYALSLASIATGIYFLVNVQEIVNRIALLTPLTGWDIGFGIATVLLTLEITRRTTGAGLTVVVLLFIAYNFFGHRLGGVLQHGYIDTTHFLDIMVFTTDGIFGLPVRVAATYAFLFVLFGTLLFFAKGSDFFFDFAAAIAGRHPGGPAKVAVVSSGLYGMISGSPTSDVVTTGSITIPIMKRLGYRGAVAGAIEAAASTGGSIMPPVLGSAAFIMAEYTGIEYRDIAVAAVLPALLYYLCVYAQVHFRARRLGLGGLPPEQIKRLSATLRQGGIFLVPLAALTGALLYGYTATMVAVMGSLAVIAVSWLRAGSRLGPVRLWQALAETTFRMVPVAGATAAAGLVIAGMTMTGLAAKFAHVVYALGQADQFTTLVIAAMLTMLLGLGMPTPAAYILAAVLMGPLMQKIGIGTLQGHLFILYFAVMSAITPPVAVAAYAASSIADDNPIIIAAHAVKLALAAFVVPFVFVFGPELLWQGPLWKTAITFVTAGVALVFIAAAVEHYDRWCEAGWQRLLLAAAGLCLIAPNLWASAAGAVLAAFVLATSRLRAPASA